MTSEPLTATQINDRTLRDDLRKRRLRDEIVHWLSIELNSRFGLSLDRAESWEHLEDMATTLINYSEVFDLEIQKQLSELENSILRNTMRGYLVKGDRP